MWESFKNAAIADRLEIDPHILKQELDSRRGLTVLANLQKNDPALCEKIQEFQRDIQKIEPNQYFQPIDELHLTILSIISCTPDLQLYEIDKEKYIQEINFALQKAEPIEIHFQGITASPNCIVIQGFPTDNALKNFRNLLRNRFNESDLHHTFDTRYKLVTAHISCIRFSQQLNDSVQLLKLCQKWKNHDFGTTKLNNFDLVFNNWYQNKKYTKILAQKIIAP